MYMYVQYVAIGLAALSLAGIAISAIVVLYSAAGQFSLFGHHLLDSDDFHFLQSTPDWAKSFPDSSLL